MADLNAIPGLSGKLAATRGRLGRLAFVRAFWPALLFVGVFLVAALLGLFQRLPANIAAGASLASLLVLALLVLRGWRTWSRPDPDAARELLDAQSPLRPVAGLSDRPAVPSGPSASLWQAHMERLKDAASRLAVPSLARDWRALDPAFLRYVLPAIVLALLLAVGSERGDRLSAALQPNLGALAGAGELRIEAWITPPAHTGRAPIFLEPGMTDLRVPGGSTVTLRAFNRSAPELALATEDGRTKRRFEATPDGAYEAIAVLEGDTRVSVHWWGERVAWDISASPDDAPQVQFVGLPSLTQDDEMQFEWAATDDYGVARLELAVRLRDPHPAAPDAEDRLVVPAGPTGEREASDTARLDTQRHRWAGLAVDVQLVAIDGAGQEGRSETYPFILPEKLFLQPLAQAAQEVRVTVLREPRAYEPIPANMDALRAGAINTAATRNLIHAPPGVQRAATMLDALTLEPHRYFEDRSVFIGMSMAHSILRSAPDKDEAESIDEILWLVALKAEYGSSADALRALQAARRALEEALRDGASEDEIRRLMQAFREAANNYVAALMAEAMMNGGAAPNTSDMGQQGGGGGLGANDFEDMLNALEDLAETGASDQARQLLSDITNMLENLEFEQGGSGGEGGFPMPGQQGGEDGEDGELPPQERELTDALEALSDMLREQRELNDDTLAEERGEGRSNQPGQSGGGNEDGEDGAGSLGDRQRDLAGRAEDLAQGQTGSGEENGDDGAGGAAEGDGERAGPGGAIDELTRQRLEQVARLQEKAAEELENGDESRARRLQDRATRELRELSGELAGRLDELRAARLGDRNASDDSGEVDPFGRPIGGPGSGDDVTIPQEADRQRARDILEELRRRYENTDDPEERRYLERLLDRF